MDKRCAEMNDPNVWHPFFYEEERDIFEIGVGEDGKTNISIDIPKGSKMKISAITQPCGGQTLQIETDAPVKDMIYELLCNLMVLSMEE